MTDDASTRGSARRVPRDADAPALRPVRPATEPASSDALETPEDTGAVASDAAPARGFRHWRRQRPFVGGLLVALGGIEMFFSGQLDIGHLHVQLGIEGLQATIIPIALLVLGILAVTMPAHHVFYGIIALVVAIYSLIGVNLGGFIIGMLLAGTGAVLVVAWMGPRDPVAAGGSEEAAS
ncbi:DUF6114 domain-containing protein [Microbacterium sp. 13-71-7]|uniref:DUF6114 domain-containing protein n=1 Tax=Microbacterium sp. 13-71-7 TaxID=1970399 RepID=UPI0026001F7F|nr:DUF6114 domain-containing protein [Microbacterium sp. 13-71-7]